MPSDATIEFLESLADESKWIIKRGVPVIAPHKKWQRDADGRLIRGKDGKPVLLYEVTEADLPDIARAMNELEAEGIPARVTVGHVHTENPEVDNPKCIGYELNARPGTFGPRRKPAVLCDQLISKDEVHLAKGRPYRSAEYYHTTKRVRGVALLTRDPYCDMGTVEYLESPEPRTYAEAIMEDATQLENDPITDEPKKPTKRKPVKTESDDVVSRLEFEEQATLLQNQIKQLDAIKAENAQLRKDLNDERKKSDTAECERILTQLQSEGYELERAEELAELLELNGAESRKKYVDRIRKRYKRSSVGKDRINTDLDEPVETLEADDKPTAEECGKASLLAAQKGITYDAALVEVRSSKK